MALQTFVKVANISSLSDARYCAGMGVDILGFNINPTSDEKVSVEDFREIAEWVAGVSFAGEFGDCELNDIKEALKNYPLDYVEITNIDQVEPVGLLGKPTIFKMTIDTMDQLSKLSSNLSYLDELVKLVIIKSSNTAIWDQIDEKIGFYNGNVKLLKGYGVGPNDTIGNFPGLELEATKEEKPGFKDYGEVMDVLEAIEVD